MLYKFYRQNRNDSSACNSIQPDYEKDCYIHFVLQDSPGNLDGCDDIPSNYQMECQKRLLRGVLGFNPDESYCGTLESRYKNVCLQALEEQKSFVGACKGILGATLGIIGLITISPFLLCGGVIFLIMIVLVVAYLWQKSRNARKG